MASLSRILGVELPPTQGRDGAGDVGLLLDRDRHSGQEAVMPHSPASRASASAIASSRRIVVKALTSRLRSSSRASAASTCVRAVVAPERTAVAMSTADCSDSAMCIL